jgi:tetratricopeptide (TPR) repeat protein
VSGWYNLGIALEDTGNLAEAMKAWDKALELDPEHVPSLKRRAAADAAQNRLDDAARRYGDALDLRATDHEARLGLADVKRRGGDAAACQREVELVLREDPQDKKAAALLPRCRSMQ